MVLNNTVVIYCYSTVSFLELVFFNTEGHYSGMSEKFYNIGPRYHKTLWNKLVRFSIIEYKYKLDFKKDL